MAQPPDMTENFVREVDENLRRDRARDFFKENGTWIALGLVLFLAACGGIIWYQQHRVKVGSKTFRPDFAWPNRKVFAEYYGLPFHIGASAVVADSERLTS